MKARREVCGGNECLFCGAEYNTLPSDSKYTLDKPKPSCKLCKNTDLVVYTKTGGTPFLKGCTGNIERVKACDVSSGIDCVRDRIFYRD